MNYLSPDEVAEMLKLHPETILRKCRSGELRASKPAGHWRISESDLEAWLDASRPVLAQPSNGDRLALPWANGGGVR